MVLLDRQSRDEAPGTRSRVTQLGVYEYSAEPLLRHIGLVFANPFGEALKLKLGKLGCLR